MHQLGSEIILPAHHKSLVEARLEKMQSVEGGILPQQMWLRLELVGRGFLQVWDCLDPVHMKSCK